MEDYHSLAQLMGSFTAFVVLLELVIFFFISIYKLATTRRLAWLVTCIFTGTPIVLMLLSFLIATDFIAWGSTPQGVEESPRASVSMKQGVIIGKPLPYELHLKHPASWKLEGDSLGLDFCLKRKGVHLGVLSQEKSLQSMNHLKQYFYDSLEGLGTVDFQGCDEHSIKIDGRQWLRLKARVNVDGYVPVQYTFFGYTGAEGTYQIISWEESSPSGEAYEHMLDLAHSFQFPKELQSSISRQG